MTMNMPQNYNQPPHYQQGPSQGFSNTPSQSHLNARYENLRPSQQNIPAMNVNRSYSPSITPQYNPNQSYSPLNVHPQMNNPQTIRGTSPNVPRQNVGGHYLNPQIDQGIYQQGNRPNNLTRQPQVYPQYGYPNTPPVYSQPSFPNQTHYQPSSHAHYQPHVQQPYTTQHFGQQVPQNYAPLYQASQHIQPFTSMNYNQARKNVPEQSINSNFSYENANFDCNYSVQENLVHCVLCNQTYKTSQKKQHLELHREKVRNVNIRPVDEQQLKRLEKYNTMTKKGLMVKPIVEPDEFNVQYNPNEFVLRKVTQYKDLDAPRTNEIQIQTEENPNQLSRPQDLGYSESRRSQGSSPQRSSRMNRISQNPAPRETTTFNRNTNTRFNADSVRQQEQIFLSDKFDNHDEGQTFKSNYNPDQSSLRESERKSQTSQKLGYGEPSNLKARNAESINGPGELGYLEDSRLQSIKEDKEEYRNSNNKDIPIHEIVNKVLRESQY